VSDTWPARQRYLTALSNAREAITREMDQVQPGEPLNMTLPVMLMHVRQRRLDYLEAVGEPMLDVMYPEPETVEQPEPAAAILTYSDGRRVVELYHPETGWPWTVEMALGKIHQGGPTVELLGVLSDPRDEVSP
jgi:hypothetical protein